MIGFCITGGSGVCRIVFQGTCFTIDPTAKYGVPSKEGDFPKTAHAQNEFSCETFDKLILASIDIIHRRPQNS